MPRLGWRRWIQMRHRALPNMVSKPPTHYIELRVIAFVAFADDTLPVLEFRSDRRTRGA
jgi:hypothetical protein